MKHFYVYLHRTTNGIPFYIGKGKGDRGYSKHGRNRFWMRVVAKRGFTVEILFSNLSESEAFSKEIETIKEYKKTYKLCNLTDGGRVSNGWVPRKETRDRISASNKGNLKHTPESKLRIAIAATGRLHTEETKKLLREKWYKHHKMDKKAIDLKKAQKISKSRTYSKKSFDVFTTNGQFIGTWCNKSKCARDLKISQPNICDCLKGKKLQHCGYIFKLKELLNVGF